VHPKKSFSPECVEGFFSEVRARPRVVASCSSVAKVDSLSKCSERRKVSEEDENKAVVRRWIEAYNERDLEAEADARAPGYVAHAPGLPGSLDSEAWTQFLSSFTESFPDIRLTVEDIVAEGDTVAARVAFHGTHRGEFQGIPPTGKEVAFSSIEIDRMVDGKVQEHWFEMDLLGLMQQLGAIPEPEQSEEASPT
jgi:steroid delta-isomerase-like uncharacterized protein